jgi:hypothetical protein
VHQRTVVSASGRPSRPPARSRSAYGEDRVSGVRAASST